jgi:hypothetical protein
MTMHNSAHNYEYLFNISDKIFIFLLIFQFSCILLNLCRSTSSGRLEVVEYSARSDLQVRTIGPGCQEPMPGYLANDPAAKDALYLGFRDQTGKSVEMV